MATSVREALYAGPATITWRGEVDGAPVLVIAARTLERRDRDAAQREAKVLGALGREVSVVRGVEVGVDADTAVVVPDTGGAPLASLVGDLPLRSIAWIADGLVRQVGTLHDAGFVHRDLNAAVALVDSSSERVELASHAMSSELTRHRNQLVHPRMLRGQLRYMAPEQTGRMNREVDYRADYYSLGIILHEMLTGVVPFDSADPMELVHAHIAKPVKPPAQRDPTVPRCLSDLVVKLLNKDADERYQSVHGIREDLAECFRRIDAGDPSSFPLGQHDHARVFRFPQALYGRDDELTLLLDTFDSAAAGHPQLLLVSGYSGVGKTALVHEVHKPITARRGLFVSGKNDQLRRNVPYHALAQAAADLIRHVLTEPEVVCARWRDLVLERVGDGISLLCELVPQLEHLVGEQVVPDGINPAEAEARIHAAFRDLFATFATAEQPLVLFIDDLQWSDRGSLLLLEKLVTSGAATHLMLVGAYRDNEVGPVHPLTLALERLREAKAPMTDITVRPLGGESVRQLVADATQCSPQAAASLTEVLLARTHGNPFFLRQFLETMHDDAILRWRADERCWAWDLDAAYALASTDNVVDFMVAKLQRLPAATQDALKAGACMGARFRLDALALVSRGEPAELADDLWEAVRLGHVVPQEDAPGDDDGAHDGRAFRFAHDRIQQAAYALIPEAERPALHLAIGRLTLAGSGEDELDERLFDIAEHLNLGAGLLTQMAEKEQLVRLNLRAARRALNSSAYQTAQACLAGARAVLGNDAWTASLDDAYEVGFLEARCAYLTGDAQRAEELYDELLRECSDPVRLTAVAADKAILFRHTARYAEAYQVCVDGLALCGVDLPSPDDPDAIAAQFGELSEAVSAALEGRDIEDLADLPRMNDPLALHQTDILDEVSIVGVFLNPLLVQIGGLRNILLSLEHGNCRNTSTAYAYYAMGLAGALGQRERGYAFGEMALGLARRQHDLQAEAKTGIWVGNYLSPFARDMAESVQILTDTVDIATRVGAPLWAAYSAFFAPVQMFHSGIPLPDAREAFDRYTPWMEPQSLAALVSYQDALDSWQGRGAPDGDFHRSDLSYAQYLEQTQGMILAHQHYYFLRLMGYTLFDRLDDAWELIREAQAAGDIHTILFGQPTAAFWFPHHALALAHRVRTTGDPDGTLTSQVTTILGTLTALEGFAPGTFAACSQLAAAEWARTQGRTADALTHYDQAIEAARRSAMTHWEALASERAARFHMAENRRDLGVFYVRAAHARFRAWGAAAKVQALEAEFPDSLLTVREQNEAAVSLDLLSVVKASQALAGEIDRTSLLQKLMRVVMENVGAERGVLLLSRPDGLMVEAQADASQETVELATANLAQYGQLPVSIVNYVERVQESVVLDNATTDPQFGSDSYIRASEPRSVLCAPIVHTGKLTGIFYFENNLSDGAFTPDRLEVLSLLSTQVSISIENAELVGNLEGKVQERTHELERANDELRNSLATIGAMQEQIIVQEKLASLGSLTTGIAHELQNPLNFINNFSEVTMELSSDILNVAQRLRGDADAAEELEELVTDVRDTSARINHHGARAASIIRAMLAHAGHSSGERNEAVLNDLIDTSVNLALRSAHVDGEVAVTRSYDDEVGALMVAEADIQRVLLNVVDNAIYAARARGPGGAVGISTHAKDDAVEVRIRDNGPGMTAEVRARIFEPFFTTKPAGEGTGLGLSLSYDIVVHGHQGALEVRSQPGMFTEFTIRLPR